MDIDCFQKFLSDYANMPITEFVFPSFQPGADYTATVTEALKHFDGVKGLLLLRLGRILQADGVDVPAEKSLVLTLGKFFRNVTKARSVAELVFCSLLTLLHVQIEWEEASNFHKFLGSDNFTEFESKVKPLVAAPPSIELFAADIRSSKCIAATTTQIFKLKAVDENDRMAVEGAWHKLVNPGRGIELPNDNSFQAWGLDNVQGEFLGMIGWDSLEVGTKRPKFSLKLTVVVGLPEGKGQPSVQITL
jgi:hypothetical protein